MNTDLKVTLLQTKLVDLQKHQHSCMPNDYKTRIDNLNKLRDILQQFSQEMIIAISHDFTHRSIAETKLLDIVPSLSAISYIKKNLYKWMRAEKRKIPWYFQLAKAQVQYQPVGVVGIVVPFNYPIQLLFTPLAYALAAGNACMINISEHMPAFSKCVIHYLHEAFINNEVFVLHGDLAIAKTFSQLPFDHLFFTGSGVVAKSILHHTAKNLTPTTLELGGKSPAMIAPNYPLKTAVRSILYSKLANGGQTCIATDHVIIAKQQLDDFVCLAKSYSEKFYPDFKCNVDISHIINNKHYQHLTELLDDAQAKGAKLIPLAQKHPNQDDNCFSPCLLLSVNETMHIMHEEIFGPILPVLTYTEWDDGVKMIQQQTTKPLIIYYFDCDNVRIKHFINQTKSGNISINSTLVQMAVNDLPFGGIGGSGMGRYHGKEGFLCFSNQRSIFKQKRLNIIKMFMPPYKRYSMQLLSYIFGIQAK